MPASALMNVMIGAARKAGRSLARDFGEVEQLQVSVKGPGNFVSAADHKAEDILYRELSKARPGYWFLMEERGEVVGDDQTHRWIVDPLDGTTNFLHGMPMFAISIGLEREGEIVAGVIYNPITDELFTAEKGKGAYLNDRRRLRVAARKNLGDALVATGIPHRGRPGHVRFLREMQGSDHAGRRRAPHRLCRAGSRLGGRRPLRRLLGARHQAVGHGGRHCHRARGGRRSSPTSTGGAAMFDKREVLAGNSEMQKALLADARRIRGRVSRRSTLIRSPHGHDVARFVLSWLRANVTWLNKRGGQRSS